MRFWTLLFIALGLSLQAQEQQIVTIETFPINAEVLFKLQGTNDKAVLKVERVNPNSFDVEVGDTLLCDFFWSTEPVKDELADFPGIEKGDEISIHIAAKRSPINGAWQYTAYHYKKRSRTAKAK